MGDRWKEMIFEDAVDINPPRKILRGEVAPHISMDIVQPFNRTINYFEMKEFRGSGSRFQNGDTLLARITPCLENGKTAFVSCLPDNAVGHGSTEFIVLSGKEGISDNLFVYYLSREPDFRNYAIQQMEGSTGRQRVPAKALSKLTINLPHLPEQKAIASILGALDDKIEMNRNMNETLEAMARAIFKSWFVDFDLIPGFGPHKDWQDSPLGKIPKGWRVGSISNIAEVSSGERPEVRQNLGTADCSIPLYGGVGQIGFVPVPLYKEPILLTGRVGTLGQIHRIVYASWPSDNTLVFRPYNKNMFEYFYFNLKSIDFDSLNRGSTQPLVTQSDLKKQGIVIPPDDVLQYYHNIAHALFLHIDANDEQSRTLAVIRDALLPKLLSGEIRVKDN